MYEISLNDTNVTFKRLEKEIYSYVCQIACNMFTSVLEDLTSKLIGQKERNILV